MAKKILIAGASGLIGSRLTELLLQKGFEVCHLSRSRRTGKVQAFQWDVEVGTMDSQALNGVDAVINLAGAGVADKRWTAMRKKEILDSRLKATALLCAELKKGNHQVMSFISATAIGYYGLKTGERLLTEIDSAGDDFLAQVTKQWEEEAEKVSQQGVRVVKLRIGLVLSEKGGALKSMAGPIKMGFGSPLGSGKQYQSWIHIDDLCSIFIKAIEDPALHGVYNAVGVHPVTNAELTRAIARVLKKPLWLPAVPGFVLRIILGEMADMVVYGSNVSPAKILGTGFRFQFEELGDALKNLYPASA